MESGILLRYILSSRS